MLRIILQIVGVIILIPVVIIITLKIDKMDEDGPSILFPGGELVSGELHTGPDPDWSFTDDIFTIELQLVDPLSSRISFRSVTTILPSFLLFDRDFPFEQKVDIALSRGQGVPTSKESPGEIRCHWWDRLRAGGDRDCGGTFDHRRSRRGRRQLRLGGPAHGRASRGCEGCLRRIRHRVGTPGPLRSSRQGHHRSRDEYSGKQIGG